ncbi:flagellar motor protein MotB [Amphritea sp. 2_MG-2023]|jgi:chemotaxis protein MotB|uniref:flagellar motor protein MotB n=1 Tax=Amphritea TaxID=515417 RepID=UPI001C06F7FF|nr:MULTISPECIES: flagellar motor protein MotB [Amphritea]MBU2965753.1 flagellar motor protein MotB [Amphritea atlantica]MDO6417309.1 flagellar motor protein MotB [Amphritea sp. 2_MG-2023]MDX2423133.1 flagellar motor protein MotB [Amphritea sp.]
MSDEELECPPCPAGLPGWMATFADLMSLLMCFFVLLLSFSEMDVLKFKQLAGSMREAFGVQNQIKVEDIPKGTSIIAQEFSPGRPEPTPLNEVRQMTLNNNLQTLDVRTQEGESEVREKLAGETADQLEQMLEQMEAQAEAQAQKEAVEFAAALRQEIGQGSIEIATEGKKIVIRVKEKGSFESGSAELKFAYIPVIAKIRDVLLNVGGKVAIEGHTDNIPVSGGRYESNWGLSTARALAVGHELFADPRIDQSRFTIIGYADTKPLAPNNTAENRSMNRRVEIIIQKSTDPEELEKLETQEPGDQGFGPLAPQDVF